jgi:hypothetical protein
MAAWFITVDMKCWLFTPLAGGNTTYTCVNCPVAGGGMGVGVLELPPPQLARKPVKTKIARQETR